MKITRVTKITDEIITAFERLIPALTSKTALPTRAALEDLVRFTGSTLFLARDSAGEIVGTATLTLVCAPTGLHARLEDVVVLESARGQGVGAALTEAVICAARELGANYLALTSNPRRAAANRLYQRLGFKPWETNVYRLDL